MHFPLSQVLSTSLDTTIKSPEKVIVAVASSPVFVCFVHF